MNDPTLHPPDGYFGITLNPGESLEVDLVNIYGMKSDYGGGPYDTVPVGSTMTVTSFGITTYYVFEDDYNHDNPINFQTILLDKNFTVTVIPTDLTPVPEPTTIILFSLGLLSLAGVSRKKQ